MAARHGCGEHTERPALDIAQIFDRFPAALETLRLTPEQAKAVGAIRACRTARLGGRVLVCSSCGYQSPIYNSCRNRHCPKCQALAQGRWVEARMAHILPVPYFHVVFTVPEQLRLLIHRNRRVFFDLIFSAASGSLMTLAADPRHLGARIGLTAVLHTWTRDLNFHPHLHTIVTGGGLTLDGKWLALRSRRFLFPVKALSRLFRGKLLAAVKRVYTKGQLRTDGPLAHLADPETFQLLVDSLYGKKWVVYSKRPFAGPAQVYAYLGHYTHRVGISNHRLLDIGDTHVRFKTRFGKTACLRGEEFVRRFLLHVLPHRFVKIRHYGLMASVNAQALDALRATFPTSIAASLPAQARTRSPDSTPDLDLCPQCGRATLTQETLLPSRSPPSLSSALPRPA